MSAVDNLKASLSGALTPLQSRVVPLLDSLSPRDRMILLGGVLAGGLALVAGAGWWMTSTLDDLREEIQSRQDTLAFVRDSAADFEATQREVEQIEAELTKHAATDFQVFASSAARTAGTEDPPQFKRQTEFLDEEMALEQRDWTVTLKRITLDEYLAFLWELEGSGYPMRITQSNLKAVTHSGEKKINATLDVSTFRLVGEEEE
jgi:type II secretory pathway component PulM